MGGVRRLPYWDSVVGCLWSKARDLCWSSGWFSTIENAACDFSAVCSFAISPGLVRDPAGRENRYIGTIGYLPTT
jgi:hypothetical protein